MRVVHFRSTFSRLSETFLFDYVRGIQNVGLDSHVLTFVRENAEERPFDSVHVLSHSPRRGVRRFVDRVNLKISPEAVGSLEWPAMRSQIRKRLREVNPNVVHAHFGREGALIAPVANQLKIPLLVTFYGNDVSELARRPKWQAQYKLLWGRVSAVTVLSEQMGSAVRALGCPDDLIRVVHLGKDLADYSFRIRTTPIRNFLSVGRLVEKKGHLEAIKVMEALNREGESVTLTIVGDGPLRQMLEAYVEEHGLQKVVRLVGAKSHLDTCALLGAADAFILPSKTSPSGDQEGTPTVLLEAQAMGLPCLTTRHAGIPEMIPEGNQWLLANEGDVEGLADAARRLIRVDEGTLADICNRGRDKVATEFDLSGEVDKLVTLYQEIVSRPQRSLNQQ